MSRNSWGSSSAVSIVVFRTGIGSILSRFCGLQVSRLSEREPDMKCAALTGLALGRHVAPVEGNDAFAEGQSQAQSIHFAGKSGINTLKAIKDPHKVFAGNAFSLILDSD